jgi:tetratricopeptide (TPR) repeat protein
MKQVMRLASVLLLTHPLFAAAMPYAPTDAEVAALPKFCAVKFKRPGPNSEAQFGRKNWIHMHHYCHGLKFVNRARNYPNESRGYLVQAKGEYEYVFKATEPTFWFRPQMYVEMARIHLQLRERTEAQGRLTDAIKLNPRYEPAYTALIKLLREDGAQVTALELATQGVRYLPASEALKKAYLDSGGKMPFPEPIAAPSSAEQPPASSAEPGEDASDPAAATATQAPDESKEGEAAPSTGCRFCPPEQIQQRWRESFQGEE